MKISKGISSSLLALAMTIASGQVAAGEDELQWLESPHDAKALAWARQQTEQTRRELGALPSRATMAKELSTILAQAPAEPDQYPMGARMARFLRDGGHPYGLLQVAPRNARGSAGEWKTVLDVAELRKREGVPFELQVYRFGSSCLAPEYTRCLLRLSPGGGDEVEIREFDIAKGEFVVDGFKVGKSRAFAEWLGLDKLLVAHTLGESPKTLAGWPASVGVWTRGEPLEQARPVYRAQASDAILQISTVGVGA
ncbi:MAG: hypothetical protein ABIV25_08115, partial [Paracoccaceae bacterium]